MDKSSGTEKELEGTRRSLGVRSMAIQVVEFSNGGYKIRKIFA